MPEGRVMIGFRNGIRRGMIGAVVAAAVLLAAPLARAQTPSVFTVGNYPVEARAQDAVAAKEKAIADGQQAAFRSLLKRLTPVTAYKALDNLRSVSAANLIEGIAVRSERNSTTSYTASLDFSFDGRKVRELLQQRGLPFVDEQAKETAIVLVVNAPAGAGASAALTAKGWRDAWAGLDLENGLAPVKLHDRPPGLTAEILKSSLSNAEAPLRTIAVLARSGQALLAVAEPDIAQRRLHVTLSGTDAVGKIVLRRSWRMDPADAAYAAELAAVVALGTLEGRWKATRARGAVPLPVAGAQLQPVQMYVEFRNIQEWQGVRRQLADLPGVTDFAVGGLSSRSADVALRYPGGGGALAAALGQVGIELRPNGGTWLARSVN
jgi:hypothetical protein